MLLKIYVLLWATIACSLLAAEVPPTKKQADETKAEKVRAVWKALEGKWIKHAITQRGEKSIINPDNPSAPQFVYTPDGKRTFRDGKLVERKDDILIKFEFDPDPSPPHLDFVYFHKGEAKPYSTTKCVYELKGDVFRYTYYQLGDSRPKMLVNPADDPDSPIVVEFKRVEEKVEKK